MRKIWSLTTEPSHHDTKYPLPLLVTSTNISPTLAVKSISREACITAACVATYGVRADGIAAALAGSP